MNAAQPPSLQPAADNDALRLPRAIVFQSLTSAQNAAKRLACHASPAGTCQPVPDVSSLGCYSATDADAIFVITIDPIGDFAIKVIAATEVARRQQGCLRARRDRHLDTAARWDADADKARKGGAVEKEFRRYASEERKAARGIDVLLVVSSVSSQPITSAGSR